MASLLPERQLERLRTALLDADFRVGSLTEHLGQVAHQALQRNETTPALMRTTDGSALSTLARLWSLQTSVSRAAAERALPDLVEPLCAAGILATSGGEVQALLDVRPYADDEHDWWVVSDLTPGLDGTTPRPDPDFVLGVSSASTSLARLVVRDPAETALDLGTGSGVQALHLSTHVDAVVGTDVNQRCLDLAATTAGLNDISVDLRSGSLYEPVTHDRFDLIVSNPPFVISPATGERLLYRDSGLPGDDLVRRVLTDSAAHLTEGGWCQLLVNWAHHRDEPWSERVHSWVAATGCDGWVVQREVSDVAEYVEMWLRDAGLHGCDDYQQRYRDWVSWFREQRIDGVGFGWVALRNRGRAHPRVRVEEWPYEVEPPLGPHIRAWAHAVDVLETTADDALAATRLRCADGVVEERVGPPGAADPSAIVLRQSHGLRRARSVSTAVAACVGACDGDLTLGQIIDALTSLLPASGEALRTELLPAVRSLLEEGFLVPAG